MSNKITVKTNVNAEVKKVWDYYTNPMHIINWNFAHPSWQCPKATNDLKVGGKYFARMEARDGSFGFDFEAIYDEVKENEGFTYTFGDRKAAVTFTALGNQTEVIVEFDPEEENPIEMQKGGWQSILDNFKNYTESN